MGTPKVYGELQLNLKLNSKKRSSELEKYCFCHFYAITTMRYEARILKVKSKKATSSKINRIKDLSEIFQRRSLTDDLGGGVIRAYPLPCVHVCFILPYLCAPNELTNLVPSLKGLSLKTLAQKKKHKLYVFIYFEKYLFIWLKKTFKIVLIK